MTLRNFGAARLRAMSVSRFTNMLCPHTTVAKAGVTRERATVADRREKASMIASDVTTKFGDPSFWERQYSSQVLVTKYELRVTAQDTAQGSVPFFLSPSRP